MPVLSGYGLRKRWRYVGAYGPELMLCCARVQVGPFSQTFWAVWDRRREELHERTAPRPPLAAGEVRMDGPRVQIAARGVRAQLTLGGGEPVEALCPSGARGYGWTLKLAGVPVRGTVALPDRTVELDCLGVEDRSAGYHARRTAWHWSAGVGTLADGRPAGWNLVTGINDPPRASERAVWIDGEPAEPDPVEFEGLEGVRFADGSLLSCHAEAERARSDDLVVLRSEYRQPFGTFSGALAGHELAEGWGVMERHAALW